MKFAVRVSALLLLCLSFAASALAQQDEITIDKIVNGATIVPGQLMQVLLPGASERAMQPLAAERFRVLVIQDGSSYGALVRSAWLSMVNLNPSSAKDKQPEKQSNAAHHTDRTRRK